MDELVAHCLREIAFDGDLGCDVARLRGFAAAFFARRGAPQTVDDAYFAFLWALLARQPAVRVGTLPPGAHGAEVWVAPPPRKRRAPEDEAEEIRLEGVDKDRPLGELQAEYGDALRVAVDSASIFLALTGSHVRAAKMTGIVYTALQLITRGRAPGLSVVDLGKKTGYDQKSCWHLVRQLVDLGLVVKLRRAGVGANLCVHRYFFEHDPLWQDVQAETLASTAGPSSAPDAPYTMEAKDEDDDDKDFQPEGSVAPPAGVTFEPIDARHLSSLPLVRARIVTLLRAAPEQTYPAQNLVVAIGFVGPNKTERRFFSTRLRELVELGVVEKCIMTSTSRKRTYEIPAVRLLDADAGEAGADAAASADDDEPAPGPLKATVTLHKQVLDLLEASGTAGLTLNDLVAALGNFDRRTLELLLARADRAPPPPHLADLRAVQMMETAGKERRYRYYTLAHYAAVVAREGLDDSAGPYAGAAAALAGVGGFAAAARAEFWADARAFNKYVDNFAVESGAKGEVRPKPKGKGRARAKADGAAPKAKRKAKRAEADGADEEAPAGALGKRKRAETEEAGEAGEAEAGALVPVDWDAPPPKKKRAPKKAKPAPDPDAPPKKRGRPRKTPLPAPDDPPAAGTSAGPATPADPTGAAAASPSLDAAEAEAAVDAAQPPVASTSAAPAVVPKKRGRPRKSSPAQAAPDGQLGSVEPPPPKKRGRPRKNPLPEPELDEDGNPVVKKRGRPRKNPVPAADDETETTPRRSARTPVPVARPDSAEEDGAEVGDGPAGDAEHATTDGSRPSGETATEDVQTTDAMDVDTVPPETQPAATTAADASNSTLPPASGPTSPVLAPVLDPEVLDVPDVPNEGSPLAEAEAQSALPPTPAVVEQPRFDAGETSKPPAPALLEGGSEHQSHALQPNIPAGGRAIDADIPIDPVLLGLGETLGGSLHATQAEAAPVPSTSRANQASATPEPSTSSARPDEKKGVGRPRGNVSLMRRENEFVKLLAKFDGIAYPASKEFTEAHLELLASLSAAGEPTSGLPGIKVDKRTVYSTFDGLELKGKVKQLKAAVTFGFGNSKQVRIAYLPTVEQEQIKAYLEQLSNANVAAGPRELKSRDQTPAAATSSQHASRTRPGPADQRPTPPPKRTQPLPLDLLQVSKGDADANNARSDKLFALDDETLRDLFLTEKNTVAQMYGWLPGKICRARELHLAGLEAFAAQASPYIVSSELRIISSSFFFTDLRLEVWLRMISTLSFNEELVRFLETEAGRATALRDLSSTIDSDLQIGKARSRARLLDLFEVLCDLKIVTPLRPSAAEDAPIRVAHDVANEHPAAFDVWPMDWRASMSRQAAPSYWRFNDHGPVFLWVLSDNSPPFWKDVPVHSVDEARAYWEIVERASTTHSVAEEAGLLTSGGLAGAQQSHIQLTRTMRRAASWRSAYELSWHQKHYLRHYIDFKAGTTPAEDTDAGKATVARLAHLTSASTKAVVDYFEKTRRKTARDIERVAERQIKPAPAPTSAPAPALAPAPASASAPVPQIVESVESRRERLARMNAQKEAQKEAKWAELFARAHSGDPLTGTHANRVSRVHTRYMHAGGEDESYWEDQIRRALQEADMANAAAFAPATRPRVPSGNIVQDLPNIVQTGKTVRELIEAQGPTQRTMPKSKTSEAKKKRKKKKDEAASGSGAEADAAVEEGEEKKQRRHRFLWNKEFDELAMDAMIVIRTRCKKLQRTELGALDQVFPAVPRNSVRQRYNNIRADPNHDSYLKRLEETWTTVWTDHRNKHEEFPDDDPLSTTNFDLVKHIEFLRAHVNKAALRLGITNRQSSFKLPTDVSELLELYEVRGEPLAVPAWEPVHTSVTEEGREKCLLQRAICVENEPYPPWNEPSDESICVTESALKMVFGTSLDKYDSAQADALLRSLDAHGDSDKAVSAAKDSLVERGVLSKLVRDPQKPRPGRTLKISEPNVNALGGPMAKDTFQDAATLESEADTDWREWDLDATDGDIAMLVQAASAGTVHFKIDTASAQRARPKLDWNSKKAVDSDIETVVSVKFAAETSSRVHDRPTPADVAASPGLRASSIADDASSPHGLTVANEPACCRAASDGVVDCSSCLRSERTALLELLEGTQRELCERILDTVHGAGSDGLSKAELGSRLNLSVDYLTTVLEYLLDATTPLVFNAGYSVPILVAASHIRRWTVEISSEPLSRVLPRRWLDISGGRIPDVWQSGQRAVMGTVLLRPGISQYEIRWRLRLLYDSQEVLELLAALHDDGFLCPRNLGASWHSLIAPSLNEEKQTWWFATERPWYLV